MKISMFSDTPIKKVDEHLNLRYNIHILLNKNIYTVKKERKYICLNQKYSFQVT